MANDSGLDVGDDAGQLGSLAELHGGVAFAADNGGIGHDADHVAKIPLPVGVQDTGAGAHAREVDRVVADDQLFVKIAISHPVVAAHDGAGGEHDVDGAALGVEGAGLHLGSTQLRGQHLGCDFSDFVHGGVLSGFCCLKTTER